MNRLPVENLLQYYSSSLMEDVVKSMNYQLFGEVIKYRDKIVTKYLTIPYVSVEKDYDNDSEYGTGEYRGLLVSIKWFETKIPVGKKTIQVPVYRKPTGQTVTFRRYGDLTPTSEGKEKK